jgi:hypothetical protein
VIWLGIVALAFFAAITPALPTVYARYHPSGSALQFAQFADGVFPFSYYRYTFFAPTIFTLRVDFLFQPPTLAALALLPFLILFWRNDLAARYLLVSSLGLLLILYVPPIAQFLETRMSATILRLWNWNSKALLIAYFLPVGGLLLRDAGVALRQRVWNARVGWAALLLIALGALLALWPLSLRREVPPGLSAGHTLPNGAPEMLRALREQTAPGEQAVVLAWRDIADAIPAYRATLMPVLFREDPASQARRDASLFVAERFLTREHLRVLNAYQVKYLIVSGDREMLSQCDLLPEYFVPLYRNTYGALYRVQLPLESNDVIDANTIASYGEWNGAIQAYNAVLAAQPDNALARIGLGIILELADKPRAAIGELKAAMRWAPLNAQAHYHLVRLYRRLGMMEEAARHVPLSGRLIESDLP